MLDWSDTGVPVGTTEQIRYGQNLIKCRSTRRYYRTDQIHDRTYSDTGVPVGTTGLIQRQAYQIHEYPQVLQNRSDSGQNLIKCRSTRRYYRTDQIHDRTYSDTGVPVGTTGLIQRQAYQIQEYP